MRKLKPVTPGELLREEFLVPMGISQYQLSRNIPENLQTVLPDLDVLEDELSLEEEKSVF